MKKIKELRPILYKQKSYNDKAYIKYDNGIISLYSYGTLVAKLNDYELVYLTNDISHYTLTTNKHINDFLHQGCVFNKKLSKNELIKVSEYLQKHDVLRNLSDLKK